jgi:hypothetical protein
LSLSLRPAWATQVDPFLKKFITTMFGYNWDTEATATALAFWNPASKLPDKGTKQRI